MTVTFKSAATGNITMLGDVAKKVLKMMGQSGNVPGAMRSADIPRAIDKLQTSLTKMDPAEADTLNDDDESDATISMTVRAQPLIKLLQSAKAAGADVIWES